jgi:hypothetical protein
VRCEWKVTLCGARRNENVRLSGIKKSKCRTRASVGNSAERQKECDSVKGHKQLIFLGQWHEEKKRMVRVWSCISNERRRKR